MSVSRRTALALVVSAVGGCGGRFDADADADADASATTETATPTGEATDENRDGASDGYALVRRSVGESVEVAGGSVTVENPRVRKSVVVDQHTSPVAMRRGTQFVVVDVAHPSSERGLGSQFRAFLDGRPAAGRSTAVRTGAHDELSVAVPAPAQPVERVGVAWVRGLPDSVLWSLPASVGERLGHEPVFTVHEVTREGGADVVVTFDVENTGDRGGTFNAVVRNTAAHDAYDVVSFDVAAGERVTEATRPTVETDPDRPTPLAVEWGTGSRRFDVDTS